MAGKCLSARSQYRESRLITLTLQRGFMPGMGSPIYAPLVRQFLAFQLTRFR